MLIDKIAPVTDAGREIGKEIAKTLARDGATAIVNYSGSVAKAEETVAEIVVVGGKAEAVQCDAPDFGKSGELMDRVIKAYGELDILMNNTGVTRDRLLMKVSEADFDAAININLKGVFNCMQHVTRQMIKQKGGQIINIASVVGVMGNAGQMNYVASKAGIIGMTKSAAREMASRGTTVNVIASGFTVTEMTDVLSDTVKDVMRQQISMKTFDEISDVAETVASLTSEEVRCITGQVISVDGGMTI